MENSKNSFFEHYMKYIEWKQEGEKSVFVPLRPVSKNALEKLREWGKPGLVLKHNDKLYFASLRSFPRIRIALEGKSHVCTMCRHQSALPDDQGGCAKCRAFARRIQDYDFIISGYETMNTFSDVFIVTSCSNWEKERYVPKKYSPLEKGKLKIELAQHLWEWVENLAEVRELEDKSHIYW